jgi:CMP-N-acetylneuraminic acid synthetase
MGLCTVCARGGSKGLPRKALQVLGGETLLARTIRQAMACGQFKAVAVSSDDEAILAAAARFEGVHLVRRPAEMATDDAPKIVAIKHCAETVEQRIGAVFPVVADLALTTPFRAAEDVVGALRLLESSGAAAVTTGSPAERSPYFAIVELNSNGRVQYAKEPATEVVSRQQSPPCFDLNGAVYAWTRGALAATARRALVEDTILYVMPRERSLDIDTIDDLRFAEWLVQTKFTATQVS